jgi:hypothetical protein
VTRRIAAWIESAMPVPAIGQGPQWISQPAGGLRTCGGFLTRDRIVATHGARRHHARSFFLLCGRNYRRGRLPVPTKERFTFTMDPYDDESTPFNVRSCAGFRMPGWRDHPRAPVAGVRKAPRHEIAGSGVPAVPRALWRFNRGTWFECRVIFRRVYWPRRRRVYWASPRRHAQLWRYGTSIAKWGK